MEQLAARKAQMTRSHVTITIEGPGGTFDGITDVVREVLERHGATVTLSDSRPHQCDLEDQMEVRARQIGDRCIDITAVHHPWGG